MSEIHLKATIPELLHGMRLDQVLAQLFPQYSRSQLQQWCKEGAVLVDNQVIARPREKVFSGSSIEVHAQLTVKEHWGAQAIPIDIVYEDETLIVVNKPPGLVVHPGAGNPDQTLVNALLNFEPQLEKIPRAGIVHRIDKDTSGLLVVARTLESHHYLVQAIQDRKVSREYEAIVQGEMISGGTVDAPIGRHPTQRTKMAVVPTGKPAITHYRVLERFPAHTHIAVILDTGRTHQIRVHMAYLHFPLVGDPTYAKARGSQLHFSEELKLALKNFKRQALHAKRLALTHPITGELMSWEAPLPKDMLELLAVLRNSAT